MMLVTFIKKRNQIKAGYVANDFSGKELKFFIVRVKLRLDDVTQLHLVPTNEFPFHPAILLAPQYEWKAVVTLQTGFYYC